MSNPPAYRLHDSLGYRLSVAARLQERRLDDWLRGIGLTRTKWCVLLTVGNEGLGQPSDIAQFVGVDRTATSRALRAMESAGLLRRHNGMRDRRTRRVELTAKGAETIEAGSVFARRNGALMAERLTPSEVDELKRLLAKLRDEDDRLPAI